MLAKAKAKLALLPLGGCGEIGMNMTILFVDDVAYFVDCGSLFPDMSQVGVDLILPGFSYLASRGIKPRAWIITHGHEDHIGGLPYFYPRFPAPIYAPPFAAELIEAKFADLSITNHKITVWQNHETHKIGSLRATPFPVNHSIPHATGLLLETPFGRVLHTGDFRIDAHPAEDFTTDQSIRDVLKGKRADIMMSDSTNSFVKGADLSESDLVPHFDELMTESLGALVVASFSSNIWRAKTVIESARRSGRSVYLLGRGTRKNVQISQKLGILPKDIPHLIEDKQLKKIDRKRLCILCTGSQGEPFSGLHRLAYDSVPQFRIDQGDTVAFSARSIPGNEKAITYLTNQLCRKGARVVHARDADIHVSGHGFQDDLIACIKAAQPRFFMPVHGEYRHLQQHIELAVAAGVQRDHCVLAENGSCAALIDDGQDFAIIDQHEAARSYVCQGGVYVDEGEIFRDRNQLARNGLVVVSISLPRRAPRKAPRHKASHVPDVAGQIAELASEPLVGVFGVPVQASILVDEIPRILESALEGLSGRKDASDDTLAEELRVGVRKYIEGVARFKCLVKVFLHRV
jgi:ribonuclease J